MTTSIFRTKKSLTNKKRTQSKRRDTLLADAFRTAFYLKNDLVSNKVKSAGIVNLGNIKIKLYKTANHFKMNMDAAIYGSVPTVLTLENNPDARDVSLDDVLHFIEHNSAGKRKYISGQFMCGDFSALIHNRAEAAGIRCGYVSIMFTDEYGELVNCKGHGINVFLTTDHGIYFSDLTQNIGYSEHVFQQKYKFIVDSVEIFV